MKQHQRVKKYRPPKNIREKFKLRCKNFNCNAELLSAEEKVDGFCFKCSKIPKYKKIINNKFKKKDKNL